VLAELGTSLEGLPADEARARRLQAGPNELQQKAKATWPQVLARQFTSVLVLVLLGAAAVSAYLGLAEGDVGDLYDAALIGAILTMNAALGFVQEYRAERSLDALRAMAAPAARVLRGGVALPLPARDLVAGDVIRLAAGDLVPADVRILSASGLATVEASLTGESAPSLKSADTLRADAPLADRRNMAFLGTSVAAGRGTAVVVETGMRTELGAIAGMVLSAPEEPAPLRRDLDRLGRRSAQAVVAAVALIAFSGFLRGQHDIELLFLSAVSLAVAAIPEGLPAVVTVCLAIGLKRMLKRRALVRRLPAVEALGAASVICTDKTGTLTKDEMHVRELVAGGDSFEFPGGGQVLLAGEPVDPAAHGELAGALAVGLLCNDAEVVCHAGRCGYLGDPTEGAIAAAAAEAGFDRAALEAATPRVGEVPFTSERKFMATLHAAVPEGQLPLLLAVDERQRHAQVDPAWAPFLCVKGAPETVLGASTHVAEGGEERPLEDDDRALILQENQRMASRALRVLALARRRLAGPVPPVDEAHQMAGLTFLGLVGLADEPRPEAQEAVERARAAGIDVVMLTGDHRVTALAVARELSLASPDDEALTGEELDRLDGRAFSAAVASTRVFARVSPRHKMRIVDEWRKRGHVVAVTGDGVNDAPALKRADIGVAMGVTGTQLAKESADMVLLDDNFETIVAAIEEGRGIFENLRKFVAYMLASNAAEVAVMFASALIIADPAYLPLLVPAQLLWINLLTDGLPALALAVDPHASDLMRRPPRSPKEGVLSRDLLFLLAVVAGTMTVSTLWVFAAVDAAGGGPARAQTAAFCAIVFAQLLFVFAVRAPRAPFYTVPVRSNPALVAAVALSALLQVAVVSVPSLNGPFHTAPLGALEWAMVAGAAVAPLAAAEAAKAARGAIERRRSRRRSKAGRPAAARPSEGPLAD
jgi:Ca2+-transporting ATPase